MQPPEESEAEMKSSTSGKSVEEFYDKVASCYEIISNGRNHDALMIAYATILLNEGLAGKRILDLGCGDGEGTIFLADQKFTVVGVDLSVDMLDAARLRTGASKVDFIHSDICNLPNLDPFDAAVAIDEPLANLGNNYDIISAFTNARGALRKGGLFVFDLPTIHSNKIRTGMRHFGDLDNIFFAWRGSKVPGSPTAAHLQVDIFLEGEDSSWTRLNGGATYRHIAPRLVENMLRMTHFSMKEIFCFKNGELFENREERHADKYIVIAVAE
ncbi:class I SAM-dependent methyltransferase [Streptomyces sp. NPDC088788]|uniref:class I SAM-dependent methyltransferase n=1 Tax=Streptomyces sp. NPDC088788 TaxID=3365898 RepID=UPI00380A442E